MARSSRSVNQQAADNARRDVLTTIGTTEHLLALILIELMSTRANRGYAELSKRLRGVGFSSAQVAAILDTSTASLYVIESRSRNVDEQETPAPAEESDGTQA